MECEETAHKRKVNDNMKIKKICIKVVFFYYRCGDQARCLDPALCCDPERDPSCKRLLECCEPYINANRFFFQLGVDSVENSKKSQNTKREHIVVMIGKLLL